VITFIALYCAIVSKLLVERLDLNARHGRIAIGVLLFQDLAVVPLLVLIPAIAIPCSDIAIAIAKLEVRSAFSCEAEVLANDLA
jgi:CPA2 family monovalent cation:H+ antiporter-2